MADDDDNDDNNGRRGDHPGAGGGAGGASAAASPRSDSDNNETSFAEFIDYDVGMDSPHYYRPKKAREAPPQSRGPRDDDDDDDDGDGGKRRPRKTGKVEIVGRPSALLGEEEEGEKGDRAAAAAAVPAKGRGYRTKASMESLTPGDFDGSGHGGNNNGSVTDDSGVSEMTFNLNRRSYLEEGGSFVLPPLEALRKKKDEGGGDGEDDDKPHEEDDEEAHGEEKADSVGSMKSFGSRRSALSGKIQQMERTASPASSSSSQSPDGRGGGSSGRRRRTTTTKTEGSSSRRRHDDEKNIHDGQEEVEQRRRRITVTVGREQQHPHPQQQQRKKSTGNNKERLLRGTYHDQSERGEEHYRTGQYAMAIASFNDAKFALLILSGMMPTTEEEEEERGEGEGEEEDPDAIAYQRRRDQINSALLSERITDCHVQEFFGSGDCPIEKLEDYSHVNYGQAAAMLTQTRTLLLEKMEMLCKVEEENGREQSTGSDGKLEVEDGNSFEDDKETVLSDMEDLSKEASLSLARIYLKQGCVCAKLGHHHTALGLFEDSIAAWVEAANMSNKPEDGNRNLDLIATNVDPLVLETLDMIYPQLESQALSKLAECAHSLKNASNIKAMAAALEMAKSHHALGVKASEKEETSEDEDEILRPFEAALSHHLHAYKLIKETQRLRAVSNVSSIGGTKTARSRATFVGAAMNVMSGGHRITTRSRDLSILMSQSDTKEMVENYGAFMKRCALLMTQQQLCISRLSFKLGLRVLSKKWLWKAVTSIEESGLSGATEDASVAMYIHSVITKDHDYRGNSLLLPGKKKNLSSMDVFSLYEGGLPALPEGYNERPRLFVHFAMAALEKGLHVDALDMLGHASIEELCYAPNPPDYYKELLRGIDVKIILEVKKGRMERAVVEMNRRLDIVSRWVGNQSVELARDLRRLGCLQSLLGDHQKCVKRLEESLHIGSDYDEYNTLDSMKLIAVSHDAINETDSAIHGYERALAMEECAFNKARLMNALSHLHMKVGGQCHVATEYLDRSLEIQQNLSNSGGEEAVTLLNDTMILYGNTTGQCHVAMEYLDQPLEILQNLSNSGGEEAVILLTDTMILYGNAMASKNSTSEAIYWYESALNSNPDKSPIHPSNLRAWYNKGVILFRSGDKIGAGHALGIILDEVEKNSTVPRGTTFVLNAIGTIYFSNKDYVGAIDRFEESLSLENDELSPSQTAGTLCNIATAYYKMGKFEESEAKFNEALKASASAGGIPSDIETIIMSKFAYILYRRKSYLRAYNMFTEAASMGNNNEGHYDKFIAQCESYAEFCRVRLTDQKCIDERPMQKQQVSAVRPHFEAGLSVQLISHNHHIGLPAQKQGVTAQKPRFGANLIPITDGHNATRYSDAVYSLNKKWLMALGIDMTGCGTFVLPSDDPKTLCDMAQEYLLKVAEDSRDNYAIEFEGLLVEKLDSNFIAMTSALDHELNSMDD